MKKALKNKDGSSLLIAIVIMMVVMLFSVTLLSASYSAYNSAVKQKNAEQCKILAQGISREIEGEITGFTEAELTEIETALALEDPSDHTLVSLEQKYPLWFYIRRNLWQNDWPYYDSDGLERGHSAKYADRYFTLDGTGENDEILDGVSIKMYWNKPTESENGNKAIRQTVLVVEVTCQKEKQKSTITTNYNVTASREKSETMVNNLYLNERWDITYASRK